MPGSPAPPYPTVLPVAVSPAGESQVMPPPLEVARGSGALVVRVFARLARGGFRKVPGAIAAPDDVVLPATEQYATRPVDLGATPLQSQASASTGGSLSPQIAPSLRRWRD